MDDRVSLQFARNLSLRGSNCGDVMKARLSLPATFWDLLFSILPTLGSSAPGIAYSPMWPPWGFQRLWSRYSESGSVSKSFPREPSSAAVVLPNELGEQGMKWIFCFKSSPTVEEDVKETQPVKTLTAAPVRSPEALASLAERKTQSLTWCT